MPRKLQKGYAFDSGHFANAMRRSRATWKISLRALSAQIGISASTLSRFESGMYIPDASDFLAICDFFDLDPTSFHMLPAGDYDLQISMWDMSELETDPVSKPR